MLALDYYLRRGLSIPFGRCGSLLPGCTDGCTLALPSALRPPAPDSRPPRESGGPSPLSGRRPPSTALAFGIGREND